MPARADLSEDELAEIREIFDHYDHNQNGVIERSEFRALLHSLDDSIGDDEIQAGLSILDDNDNGVIDFDEFLEWWADR